MMISHIVGALLIAAPTVLGVELYNVMPRNSLCSAYDSRTDTPALETQHDWAIWVQRSSIYGGDYLNGRGSLEKADDGSTLHFTGFWSTVDNMKTATIDITFSQVLDAEEAVIKRARCPDGDNPTNKVFYNASVGTIQLYEVGTKSLDTYEFELQLNMNSAQLGTHGSSGNGCCGENKFGFASWLKTKNGPNIDLNVDLELVDTCVVQGNTEYVAMDHPGGSQQDRFNSGYGIIADEIFADSCVNLPVGYNAFSMKDVRVELDDSGKRKHMYGRVSHLLEVNGEVTHLFDMWLDAWWTGSEDNTFTYSADGNIVSFLNDANGGFAYATLTEIVAPGVDPLVIELTNKEGPDPDVSDNFYSYQCKDSHKGAPGCHGWLMFRVAAPGRYSNGQSCDRCAYPMPKMAQGSFHDWLVAIDVKCTTSGPQNIPAVPALEPCCSSFNVLAHDVACTSEEPKDNSHVLFVSNQGENIYGKFSEGSGSLQRVDSTSLQLTGLWADKDYIFTAKVSVLYSDPVNWQDALIKNQGCSVSNVFDKTFYSRVTGTIELYSSLTGETEVYDVTINPMVSAQIGSQGSAKKQCCGDNRQGVSSWLLLDGTIRADFNFDIECGSGTDCAAALQASADGVPLVFDDFTAPQITMDETNGAVSLDLATADGSPVSLLTNGGLVSTACIVDGAAGRADLTFAPDTRWGNRILSAPVCGKVGTVDLQWNANGQQCQTSIQVTRGCGTTIPTCKTTGDPHTKTLDLKAHHYGDGDFVNIFVSPNLVVRGEHFITRHTRLDALHGPSGQVSTYQSISMTYLSEEGTTVVSLAKPSDCQCTADSLYKGVDTLDRNTHNCDDCAQRMLVEGPHANIVRVEEKPDGEWNVFHHIYFRDGSHATLFKRASPGNNYVIDAYIFPSTRHRQFDTSAERGVCGNWDGDAENDQNSGILFNTPSYPGFWDAGVDFLHPVAAAGNTVTGPSSAFPVQCTGGLTPSYGIEFLAWDIPPATSIVGYAQEEGVQLTNTAARRRRNTINLDTLVNCDKIINAVYNMECIPEDIVEAVANCKNDVDVACNNGESTDCVRSSYISLMSSCKNPGVITRRRANQQRACVFPQGIPDGNGGCTCEEGFKGRRCQHRKGSKPSCPDGVKFYTQPPSSADGQPACTDPRIANTVHLSAMVHELPVVRGSKPQIFLRVKKVEYEMTCEDCCEDGEDCSGEYTVTVNANELPTERAKWNGKNKRYRKKVGMRVVARYLRTNKKGQKLVNRRVGVFKMPVCA